MKSITEPSFYEQLCVIDVIDPVIEPFMQGQLIADIKTKKLRPQPNMALNRTWIFAKVCQERKCLKWHAIYNLYYKILPPPCKQCWKIVYVPDTLTELFQIQAFQEKQGLPAKCGTEARDYTSGLGGYRAYWYCPFYDGLDGARKYFERIVNELSKEFGTPFIDIKVTNGKLFLKRGCTEFERDFGPSDKWDSIDHSAKFNILETVWDDPAEMTEEWSPIKYTNFKRWIEYAVAYGDPDALNYVRGKSLGVPAVTYHNSRHKAGQFKNSVRSLNGQSEDGGNNGTGKEKKADLFRFES